MYVCERLSKLVCYHQSEWGVKYSSLKQEIETLLDKGIEQEEDKDIKKEFEKQKEQSLQVIKDKVNVLDFWAKVKVSGKEIPADMTYDTFTNKYRKMHLFETVQVLHPDDENQGMEQFPTDTKVYHFHPNAFVEQMRRLRPCSCPVDEPLFKCSNTKYGVGPVYLGKTKGKAYNDWDELISQNKVSIEEKKVICVMSENEGKLETIQSYDSEVLTFGFMQKTINSSGTGEFATQVYEFKESHPNKYQKLFLNCGWSVKKDKNKKNRLYYKSREGSESITGTELKALIRKGFTKEKVGSYLSCEPLSHLIKVGCDKDFQKKQALDYVARVRFYMNKSVDSYKIKEYIRSALGMGLILDHSVNRPSHVSWYFEEALNRFFTKKDTEVDEYNKDKEKDNKKSKIPRNPTLWSSHHANYEQELLGIYGPLRGVELKKDQYPPMSDALYRYKHLKKKL